MNKMMSLRLPADQAEELEVIAQVDGVPVSEAVRDAITERVAARRQDPDFQKRLRDHMKRNAAALKRLAS